jgi:dipeptidyl aminopeptidase/acylaminoacyl peptidase
MLGVTNNLPDFEDLSMGSKKETSTVQGIVSWYGVSDISSLTDAGKPFADKIMGFDVRKNRMKTYNASPIELVTDQHPPLLLVHGTMDEVVPYQQSVNMQKKINNVTGKQTAVLIPFIRAAHSDNVIKSNDSIAECLDFIDGILFKERNPYRSQNFITVRVK